MLFEGFAIQQLTEKLMLFRNINKDKLHAALCIAASAAVSLTIIVLLFKCLS